MYGAESIEFLFILKSYCNIIPITSIGLERIKNMSQDSFQSSYTPVHYGKLATEFSKERGQWLLANVEQQIGWPQKRALIIYRGRKVLLLPATSKYYAGVAVITKIGLLDEGKKFVMQFLSALTWYRPSKIDIIQWTNSATQGSLNQYLRLELTKRPGMTALFFRPTMLPDPKNKDAQLALSLFREGLSLNHLGYSFLSYYKIINMRYPKGAEQKQWIRNNLYKLENLKYLAARLGSLKQQHTDLAHYIYTECRCAVAHAGGTDPVYDPESLEDEIRFYEIQPLAHALAKIIIEDEFFIKTTNTILKEHLYELEGFYYLIGDEVTKRLKDRQNVSTTEIQIPHLISLRLWGKRKFSAFENLSITVISINKGVVQLKLTRDDRVIIPLALDFPNEKLIFEPMAGVELSDDGTPKAALQFADAYRFYGEIIANGVLEVWNADSNLILGRLLEYLPVNILPAQTKDNLIELEKKWREEAKRRRAAI